MQNYLNCRRASSMPSPQAGDLEEERRELFVRVLTATAELGATRLLLQAIAKEDSLVMERALSEEFGELTTCEKNEGLMAAIRLDRRVFAERLIYHAEPADIDCEDTEGNTPLILAAAVGATDIARTLVKKGCDIDAEANNGKTALHEAVWIRCTPIIRILIRAQCDIDPVDNKYRTPLMFSAEQGFEDVIAVLLKAGAKIPRKNQPEGQTALHLAAKEGHLGCVKLLVQHYADMDAKDRWVEATPLAYAVQENHMATVEWLIQKGADLHGKDRLGRSLMHLAVGTGNPNLVQLLLEKGVTPNGQAGQKKLTPLMDALQLGKSRRGEVVKLLLRYGANHMEVCQETIQYKYISLTPLQFAIYKGLLDEAKILYEAGGIIDLKQHEQYNFDTPVYMIDWIESVHKLPRSLMNICGIAVNNSLPNDYDRVEQLKSLPLPIAVQKYLCPVAVI